MLSESSECLHENRETKIKPLTRRRYKLPHPDWQKPLLSYYKMVNKKTTLTSSKRTSVSVKNKKKKTVIVDLVDELPEICESDEIYILLATVSLQVNELVPAIILVHENSFNQISACESKIIKYNINSISYAGRILASSKSRKELESTFDTVSKDKPGLFKQGNSTKNLIFYSLTCQVEITQANSNEILVLALSRLLENVNSNVDEENIPEIDSSLLQNYDPDYDENTILNSTPNSTAKDTDTHPLSSISLSNVDTSFASSFSATGQQNIHDQEMDNFHEMNEQGADATSSRSEIAQEEDSCSRAASLQDASENVTSDVKTRKRRSRKKYFADSKLLARVKTQAVEQKKNIDESIEASMDFVKQTLNTLKPSKPYRPILVHLFKMITDINSKMEQNEKLKSSSSGYKIERKIEVKKIKDKDIVKIDKKLNIELSKYGYAIDPDQPHLIVSRFMRRCFDKRIKIGSEVNDKADDSNFIYRIGSPEFEGHERLEDGQKVIDMIIDHAHQVLGLDYVYFKEYRECMTQVTKAIYDANRAEGSKTRKIPHDQDIESSQQCKRKKLVLETDDEDEQDTMKTKETRVEMFI